jgi:mono/diheme cytochrome c family protein
MEAVMRRGLGVAGLTLALVGCGAEGDRPGMVVFPEMYYSVPYDAYDPNPNTASGHTLLAPPEGTIPYGQLPFPFVVGQEEATRAGLELHNPVAGDDAALQRGREVYENICSVCHGPSGEGDGPVVGAGRFPNPPSLHAAHARELPDGQIFHVVTRGQGIMPSHAAQVLPEDRWRVIHHLRTLQGLEPGGDQ